MVEEWRGARVVEWDGLEHRYTSNGIVSSNLTPAANLRNAARRGRLSRLLQQRFQPFAYINQES